MPDGVVTATLFAPAAPAGVTAVIRFDEKTTTLLAGTPPTVTVVAKRTKLVPVIVIAVPPRVDPVFGVTATIVGTAPGATYVNAPLEVVVPLGVVTVTFAEPAAPAGVTAVIEVAEITTRLVAEVPPTVTLVAPVKLVPVIVIAVPPRVEPVVGATAVIVGAGKDPQAPRRIPRSTPLITPSPLKSAAARFDPQAPSRMPRSVPFTNPSPFASPGSGGTPPPVPSSTPRKGLAMFTPPPTSVAEPPVSTRKRSSPPTPSRFPRELKIGVFAPRSVCSPRLSAPPGAAVFTSMRIAALAPAIWCTLTMSRTPSLSASINEMSLPAIAPCGAIGTAAPNVVALPRKSVSTDNADPPP